VARTALAPLLLLLLSGLLVFVTAERGVSGEAEIATAGHTVAERAVVAAVVAGASAALPRRSGGLRARADVKLPSAAALRALLLARLVRPPATLETSFLASGLPATGLWLSGCPDAIVSIGYPRSICCGEEGSSFHSK